MTPSAIVVGMPRCAPPAVAVAAAGIGERRGRGGFCRPVAAACGGGVGDEEQKMPPPPSMAAMPASLRAIQAKRKLEAVRRGVVPRAARTSAVAALVAVVEAVQGAAAGGAAEAARGAGDAMAWVIRKVHLESPDLAVGLLGLVASCLGTVVEVEMDRIKDKEVEASAAANKAAPDNDGGDTDQIVDADAEMPELVELDMETELWSRIGIMHNDDEDTPVFVDEDGLQEIIDIARVHRRKAAYERIIATADDVNSLILSNYAQLLYQFDKDLDRAEDYFKQAVAVEPVDGEAMRRYALFMWHARGDLVGAEDMFTRAIDEEPQSSQHRSSYAWFLWMTGGVETCLIDSGNDAE
ncbi:hypothetical protein E2562_010713 [Oryza meyeriana var. granulata]|uniref:Uncharacterized protein n=1 Tax=Oryza meyeriana var. granulata TaxID=110450 RepID=A0A6G1EW63_9ORYZ|nr:hypothetical protein E2562_010713 [Oryza meyeriana var. granulata]